MSIKKVKVHGQDRFQVRYRDPSGVQRKKNFLSKREAQSFEDSELTDIRRGAWVDSTSATTPFATWATEWLNGDPSKRDTSYARDEIVVRLHLIPALGKRAIGSITPIDVQRLVNTWTRTLAASTVRRQYQCLAAIFNAAATCDLIVKSPCRAIKLPRAQRKTVELISDVQLQQLVAELGSHGLMAYLGALLGLRWGEVAGLRVKDIHLLRHTITIRTQITRDRHGRPAISEPKTDAGKRTLSVPPQLSKLVAIHIRSLGLTARNNECLLFPDSNGEPLRYSNWRRRAWVPACERSGLVGLGFHDLRRINATAMVVDGVDIKTAQARLGHADPRMTLSIYAQSTAQGDHNAATHLAARFLPNVKPREVSSG